MQRHRTVPSPTAGRIAALFGCSALATITNAIGGGHPLVQAAFEIAGPALSLLVVGYWLLRLTTAPSAWPSQSVRAPDIGEGGRTRSVY